MVIEIPTFQLRDSSEMLQISSIEVSQIYSIPIVLIISKSNIMTYISLSKNIFLLILYKLMRRLKDQKLLGRIALVLKELRDEKNLSQEDVYNETNIHIGRIESSKANPTISTLSALCDYFDIRISDFFKKVEKR